MKRRVVLLVHLFSACVVATESSLSPALKLAATLDKLTEQSDKTEIKPSDFFPQNDHELSSRGDCIIATQINQSNVPFTISTPGSYCVVEGLAAVSAASSPLINITSDNVVLDLNDQIITGAGLAPIGIRINANNNVIIRNGSLLRFTSNALQVNQNSQQIQLNNIIAINNNVGFSATGMLRSSFQNCAAILSTQAGFFITNGVGVNTQNCVFQQCYSFGNSGIGSGLGFFLNGCINCFFPNCIAYANGVNGFVQTNCQHIIYQNCISSGNGGFGFSIASNNTTLQNCFADNNRLAGFRLLGNQIRVSQCQAEDNENGFRIEGNSTNTLLLESTAVRNRVTGFHFDPGTTELQVRNNTATGNLIFGFENQGIANRIYANWANNNGTNFVGIPNFVVSPTPLAAINFTTNIAN